MKIAVYPGSFDPITNGHIDIIQRSRHLFDKVIVAVAHNPEKKAWFTVDERLELLKETLKDYPNVTCDSFSGLTVAYARKVGASALIRGLRAISDFENEFMMALMNRNIAPELETVFLMTSTEYTFLSSSAVKELVLFGGPVSSLVPPVVAEALARKAKERFNSEGGDKE
ncbi:MAG: pantetheine-phosphate adenylyltransferase [Firmicutes bacterium]|nr:pantetheine-phosphate adenylyltransferase [Bacillota bacterium]